MGQKSDKVTLDTTLSFDDIAGIDDSKAQVPPSPPALPSARALSLSPPLSPPLPPSLPLSPLPPLCISISISLSLPLQLSAHSPLSAFPGTGITRRGCVPCSTNACHAPPTRAMLHQRVPCSTNACHAPPTRAMLHQRVPCSTNACYAQPPPTGSGASKEKREGEGETETGSNTRHCISNTLMSHRMHSHESSDAPCSDAYHDS